MVAQTNTPPKPKLDDVLKQEPRPRMELIWQTSDMATYLDNQSININQNRTIASYWSKTVFAPKTPRENLKDNEASYMLTFDEMIIGNRKVRIMEVVIYSKKNQVIENVKSPPNQEWSNVIPQSNGESMYEAVMTRLRESKIIK